MSDTRAKDPFRTTFHRNGGVTLWDVYRQQWVRCPAGDVGYRILATLSPAERERILRIAAKEASNG